MSFNLNIRSNIQLTQTLNPQDVARNLCNTYYGNMSTIGVNSVANLFEPNACCNYNGIEYIGAASTLTKLAENGVTRVTHDRLTCVYQVLAHDSLLVQVFGIAQGVTYLGLLTDIKSFSETFVLTYRNDGRLYITNHILKFL